VVPASNRISRRDLGGPERAEEPRGGLHAEHRR
jgi:hypothetical protein